MSKSNGRRNNSYGFFMRTGWDRSMERAPRHSGTCSFCGSHSDDAKVYKFEGLREAVVFCPGCFNTGKGLEGIKEFSLKLARKTYELARAQYRQDTGRNDFQARCRAWLNLEGISEPTELDWQRVATQGLRGYYEEMQAITEGR